MHPLIIALLSIIFVLGIVVAWVNLKSCSSDNSSMEDPSAAIQTNKCFTSLSWPNCKPSATAKACSDIVDSSGKLKPGNEKETCCLSNSIVKKDLKSNNCPPGWTNNPTTDWCTSKFNLFSANEIRHKCYKIPTTVPPTTTMTSTTTTTSPTITPGTVKDITIYGSNGNNNIILSIAVDGKINFSQHIERTQTDTINPTDDFASDAKTMANKPTTPLTVTTKIIADYVYVDGIFYVRKITTQSSFTGRKESNKAYDLSKGPLPPFRASSPYESFRRITGGKDPSTFFTPQYMEEFSNMFTKIIIPNVKKFNKENKRNIVLSTADDYLQTTWFNICGLSDRLWLPNGTLNTKFMGLQNIRVTLGAIKLQPSWTPVKPVSSYTIPVEGVNEKGQPVMKDVEMPFTKFNEINPFKDFFTAKNGFDPELFDKNPTVVRFDPISGVNLDALQKTYEPLINEYMTTKINELETILLENISYLYTYLQKYNNIFDINYIDYLKDVIIPGKEGDKYSYLPIILNSQKIIEDIAKNGEQAKSIPPKLFSGVTRTNYNNWVSIKTLPIESVRQIIKDLQKKYDACRADIAMIKQPYTNGNSCPDSQDALLSQYVYNPAFNCSWAKIGDAWTSVESMDNDGDTDNLAISEWGRLYHDSANATDYQKIVFTFEGSQSAWDFLADFAAIPIFIPRIGSAIHIGFWHKFSKWIPTILKYLRAKEKGISPFGFITYSTWAKKIIFGGHSLGGAQAQVAAAYFKASFPDVEIEVFSQAAPSPFWLSKPIDYPNVSHPRRFKTYYYDECIFVPNRDDPVPDIMYWLGFWHWLDFEAPVRRVVKRKWEFSWDGWCRCAYNGGRYDIGTNPISILRVALDVIGFVFAAGIPIGEILDFVLGAACEHGMGTYIPNINGNYCAGGYWDPTPDIPIR